MNSPHLRPSASPRSGILRTGLAFLACCFSVFLGLPHLSAQSGGTATIVGVVSNAGTRQFLNEAEVRVEGTNLSTLTERDGTFSLRGLKPGTYDVAVSYTGLDTERRSVTVTADAVS